MASGYPIADACNGNMLVAVATNSYSTLLNAVTVTDTKTAWLQLVASTPSDTNLISINSISFTNTPPAANMDGYSVDIGIGAAASEKVIIADLYFPLNLQIGSFSSTAVTLPFNIKAGSRISARAQSHFTPATGDNSTVYVNLALFDTGFAIPEGVHGIDALGFTAASTTGTSVTPGNQTMGSAAQLVASTTRDYVGLFASIKHTASHQIRAYDFMIGGAGAEQDIVNQVWYNSEGPIGWTQFFPVAIPAASRLSVRGYSQSSDVAAALVVLYGAYL